MPVPNQTGTAAVAPAFVQPIDRTKPVYPDTDVVTEARRIHRIIGSLSPENAVDVLVTELALAYALGEIAGKSQMRKAADDAARELGAHDVRLKLAEVA